ncbi:MAG: Gamma-glutamylcyclotransferase family protein YtfP [Myxococcota bacterium]|nr:Gamma-glutamylcyclotransferase family protein YtfP [Myxococcota bacterium]
MRHALRFFVYGTLLRREPANHYLKGCRCLGRRQTLALYSLVNLGRYPGLVRMGRTGVRGEVYEIDTRRLILLDKYERVPVEYTRQLVRLTSGEQVLAYALNRGIAQGHPVVPRGDWRRARGTYEWQR